MAPRDADAGRSMRFRAGMPRTLASMPMHLPFQPPLEPMLAKAVDGLPERRRLAVRAEVGRLPRDRLPRRRRDLHAVARPQAARPLLPGARRAAPGGAARALRPRRRDRHRARRGAPVRVAAPAHPSRRVAGEDAGRGVARAASWPGTSSRSVTRTCATRPQGERRARLEAVLGAARPPIHLTPATLDRATAADWFDRFEGAGLDGVVAKRLDAPYQPGKRAMLKIKHQRTADCVGRRVPLAQERAGHARRLAAAGAVRRRRARSTTSA